MSDMAKRIANWAKAEYGPELFGVDLEKVIREAIHDHKVIESAKKRNLLAHAKLHELGRTRAAAQSFYDWLHEEKGFTICQHEKGNRYKGPSGYWPINIPPHRLLGEFLGVDPDGLEKEKLLLLKQIRDERDAASRSD